MRFGQVPIFNKGEETLEVRIKDTAKNILFRGRCNISDKGNIKRIFNSLEKWGIDIEEIMDFKNSIKQMKAEEREKRESGIWW